MWSVVLVQSVCRKEIFTNIGNLDLRGRTVNQMTSRTPQYCTDELSAARVTPPTRRHASKAINDDEPWTCSCRDTGSIVALRRASRSTGAAASRDSRRSGPAGTQAERDFRVVPLEPSLWGK